MKSHFFFFNDTATTEIYTLSLHDALPICPARNRLTPQDFLAQVLARLIISVDVWKNFPICRSEEHTSELQSRPHLVCRLLLEKKKIMKRDILIEKSNNRSSFAEQQD